MPAAKKNLTEKQLQVIREYVENNRQYESWAKVFGSGKENNDRANACNFFKRPEVKQMAKMMIEARDRAAVQAMEKAYEKMYIEQIATELELDIFHTKVVRGEIPVQETFAVREKKVVYVTKKVKGKEKTVPVVEDKVIFKKVDRQASLKERQFSAAELYKRSGSYKPFKIKSVDLNQDDQEAAEIAKAKDVDTIQRFVILSNGTQIPMG
jgi:hypothetical protein